jgi:hypothetical protein
MKTIDEIMKATECTREQAERLYDDLTKLPEKLGEFISDNLDRVNAYNADEIDVIRHGGYSRYGANIIVKRQRTDDFATYLDGTPWYNHWKYCFDVLINYVGESCY